MMQVAGFDSSALEKLYDRYSTFLFTLINKTVSDEQLAEEILSDVFVIIWNRNDHFDFKANNVYTWLVTLAKNKAVDSLKRKKGTSSLPRYTSEYEIENIIPHLSTSAEPMDLNKVLSMKDKINDSFNKLTDAQQYVLNLAYYEGYNEQEIARELNIPLPTVKSKISIALSNLNKNLATEE